MSKIVVTGRELQLSPGVRKLNPSLWPEGQYNPIHPELPETIPMPKKRIRQSKKPLLNKLESEFKEWYERSTGYIVMCQAIRFRIGNGIWYKPDFTHFNGFGRMTCIEVKGPWAFRGGFENLKVAAGMYRDFSWKLWWKKDGQWHFQDVLP